MEEYVDSYNQPNEPLFTKMLHEFHLLGEIMDTSSGECSVQPVRP